MKVERSDSAVLEGGAQSMTTQAQVAPAGNDLHHRAPSTRPNSLQKTHSSDPEFYAAPHSEEQADVDDHLPNYEESNSDFDRDQELNSMRAQSSHDDVPVEGPRCALVPSRRAIWLVKGANLHLCTLATTVLVNEGVLDPRDLETISRTYADQENEGPRDPITGVVSAAFGTAGNLVLGVADYPILISKALSSSESNPQRRRDIAADFALDHRKGVSRIVGTSLRAPMDLSLSLAQGFHNFPKVYGDSTVRKTDKITGVGTGLKVAGKNLGLGLFDGVTGIFSQPVLGAVESGPMGCLKGFGKGIGGAVCKPAAGVCGVPGYTFKGIYEQVHKKRSPSAGKYDVAARTAQGWDELESATEEERNVIIWKWYEVSSSFKKHPRPATL